MKRINLQMVKEGFAKENFSLDINYNSVWFWLVIIESIIIFYLIMRLIQQHSKSTTNDLAFKDLTKDKLKKAKASEVDMNNLMKSINGSKVLYKELSRACHPDRFVNSDKQIFAEDIFQEISKNRRDFQKLQILKERAINELNINF